MSSHNHYPDANEELPTAKEFEIVGYNDGSTAIRYSVPGTTVILGEGSPQKHARGLWAGARAIINTKSGNSYGFGDEFVINKRDNAAYPLQIVDIEVTIGQECEIPGVALTTDVQELLLLYKLGGPKPDVTVDAPSPFVELEQKIELASIMSQGSGGR